MMKKLPELPVKDKTLFKLEVSTTMPKCPNGTKESLDFRDPLIAPYAYAHIYWDSKSEEIVYEVEEPELVLEEKKILNILETSIKELINMSYLSLKKGDTIINYLEKNLKILLSITRSIVFKESVYFH